MKTPATTSANIFRKDSEVGLPAPKFFLKFGASLAAFLTLITLVATSSPANDISITLFRILNNPLPNALGEFLLFFMEFGSFWIVALIIVSMLALRRWLLAASILVAEIASFFIANSLKLAVTFERPYLALEDVFLRIPVNMDLLNAQLRISGFPSGHTAAATILVVILWAYVTSPMRKLLLVLLAAVAFGRIYAGVHFPLDVLGGLTLGLTLGLLVRQLSSQLKGKSFKRWSVVSRINSR